MGLWENKFPFIAGIDGRLKKVGTEHSDALLNGEAVSVCHEDWGKESSVFADLERYRGDGPLPCFVGDASLCPRQILLRQQRRAGEELGPVSYSLSQSFYVFPDENFQELLSGNYAGLEPLNRPVLAKEPALFPEYDAAWSYDETSRQFTVRLHSADALRLADDSLIFRQRLVKRCGEAGVRPFFAPKMDRLPPSGMHISFEIDAPEDVVRSALRGVCKFAPALTLATCGQVNSYKRLTPQELTDGWDSPKLVKISGDKHPHAVAWLEEGNPAVITLRQADAYSNVYFAFAVYLEMFHLGLRGGRVSGKEWDAMLRGAGHMPTSLNVARQLWENSPVGRDILGKAISGRLVDMSKHEWAVYCDIAHPWELLRGLEYEKCDG